MNTYFKLLSRFLILNFIGLMSFIVVVNKNQNVNAIPELANNPNPISITPLKSTITPTKSEKVKGSVSKSNLVEAASPTPTKAQVQSPIPRNLGTEISLHNTPSDCWLKINSNYYNITSYFGKHPGGDGYLTKYCGKDATQGFNSKDSIPAKIHSQVAQLILAKYLIQ